MISIVIPAYNEEQGVAVVLGELRQVLATGNLDGSEIVVVDDGSTDATFERAKTGGADLVIRHPQNLGYGRSLKDGIAATRHDIIVIVDADGSYPLQEIPRLLRRLDEGFDMVVGARSGPHYRESALKAPLRSMLKFLVEFTVGRRVADVNSGLRVFRKSTVLPYLRHLSNSFSFTTSLTLAYLLTSRFVDDVPIDYRPRVGKTNVRLVRDSLRTLQYIVQNINYYNPIKLFLLLSLGCLVISALSFVLAAASLFPLGSFAGAVGLLASIIVFALGLVADLLRANRLE